MPTYAQTDSFRRDHKALTPEEKAAFRHAVDNFIHDLGSGKFRKGLGVKRVQGTDGIYEMRWADDGRATFQFGSPILEGHRHIIWRRIGGHKIFGSP